MAGPCTVVESPLVAAARMLRAKSIRPRRLVLVSREQRARLKQRKRLAQARLPSFLEMVTAQHLVWCGTVGRAMQVPRVHRMPAVPRADLAARQKGLVTPVILVWLSFRRAQEMPRHGGERCHEGALLNKVAVLVH